MRNQQGLPSCYDWRDGNAPSIDTERAVVERIIQSYGRVWQNQPRPRRFRRRTPGQCYYNAQRLVLEHPNELVYVEGEIGIDRILHGWTVDRQGGVIETTWDYHPSIIYFGVPINSKWLAQSVLQRNGFADLLYSSVSRAESLEDVIAFDLLGRLSPPISTLSVTDRMLLRIWSIKRCPRGFCTSVADLTRHARLSGQRQSHQ